MTERIAFAISSRFAGSSALRLRNADDSGHASVSPPSPSAAGAASSSAAASIGVSLRSASTTAGHTPPNASSESSRLGAGAGASGSTVATAVTAGAGSASVASSSATAAAASSAASCACARVGGGAGERRGRRADRRLARDLRGDRDLRARRRAAERRRRRRRAPAAARRRSAARGAARGGLRALRRLRRRGGDRAAALEPLEAGQQRLDRGLEVGRGGLDERELELGAGVGAVLHRAQGGGDQLEQADDLGAADALGLLGQALVLLGRDAQLGRHLAEHLHDHQPAGVGLEVGEEAAEVAAGLGEPGGGEQRGARVAGGDRVDGAEQQVGVRGAEHREHVVQGDRRARVREQLLERAERVAERAGRRAGDQRDRLVGDRRSTPRRPRGAGRPRSGSPTGARSRTGGSGPRPSAGPCWPRSSRARRSCAAAAPRAS